MVSLLLHPPFLPCGNLSAIEGALEDSAEGSTACTSARTAMELKLVKPMNSHSRYLLEGRFRPNGLKCGSRTNLTTKLRQKQIGCCMLLPIQVSAAPF